MTGKRTGQPNQVRPTGECMGCGRWKALKARRLCESCYIYAGKMGVRDEFPTKAERESARTNPDCTCYEPIREELPLYGAVQCKKCGKRLW